MTRDLNPQGERPGPDRSTDASEGLLGFVRLLELGGVSLEETSLRLVSTRDFSRIMPLIIDSLRENNEAGVLTNRNIPSFLIVPIDVDPIDLLMDQSQADLDPAQQPLE